MSDISDSLYVYMHACYSYVACFCSVRLVSSYCCAMCLRKRGEFNFKRIKKRDRDPSMDLTISSTEE